MLQTPVASDPSYVIGRNSNLLPWLPSPISTLRSPRGGKKKDSHIISMLHSFCSSVHCFFFMMHCHGLLRGYVPALFHVATNLLQTMNTILFPRPRWLESLPFLSVPQGNCRSWQQRERLRCLPHHSSLLSRACRLSKGGATQGSGDCQAQLQTVLVPVPSNFSMLEFNLPTLQEYYISFVSPPVISFQPNLVQGAWIQVTDITDWKPLCRAGSRVLPQSWAPLISGDTSGGLF